MPSLLQKLRQEWRPQVPEILRSINQLSFSKEGSTTSLKDADALKTLFPKTFGQPIVKGKKGVERSHPPLQVGVVFSGGQAAGGHNVIAGLFDALNSLNKDSKLFGFLGGPGGIISAKQKEITKEVLAPFRNQGGFDLIGSGRTKIETEEQLKASKEACQSLNLDGLVVIGGDDSNTNAAVLAEYFLTQNCKTKVIGVPKTIDGDLKNEYVATSFGFDTACKVYIEAIGNIARDALSAKKYYHFIKLMGRSASHIALECALCTHPNIVLISEEVSLQKKTLSEIIKYIADVICKRSELGKDYGIVLIPEGLIEFIPEMGVLIAELNQVLATSEPSSAVSKLSPSSAKFFQEIPDTIQKQLLFDRDPHGNVQVSLIETEKLFLEIVGKELQNRKKQGSYQGKFNGLQHFFGYEGRAGFPSNFDANYCYALGHTAALLVADGHTGYMCSIQNLTRPPAEWQIGGIPITMLMNIEQRKGRPKPVIQKALVNLNGKPFLYLQKERKKWETEDDYQFPGPMQFFGEASLCDLLPMIMTLN